MSSVRHLMASRKWTDEADELFHAKMRNADLFDMLSRATEVNLAYRLELMIV